MEKQMMSGGAVLRRWRFRIDDHDGNSMYVAADGRSDVDDLYFIGTDDEALREADRRADAYARHPEHGLCARVTYESEGVVAKLYTLQGKTP